MFCVSFPYYEFNSLTAECANMTQHDYFKILDYSVLTSGLFLFSEHLHDEYTVHTPIYQDDVNKIHPALIMCDWYD